MFLAKLFTPILMNQTAFDATMEHVFEFQYERTNQSMRNKLTIYRNFDNTLVYAQFQDTFRLEHLLPANTLTNGEYYVARIQVFDNDGNSSDESAPIQFYCYSTPIFRFDNLVENQIIKNSAYDFKLIYMQNEGELLDLYQINLYDNLRTEIYSSGFKTDADLSDMIVGLESNQNYYVRARGQTVQGMMLDTGYVHFSVTYSLSNAFAVVELENQYSKGCIRIASNIVSLHGSSNSDNLSYIDGTWVDLSNGDWVVFDEGLHFEGDFALAIIGKEFETYGEFFELRSSADANRKLTLTYMRGVFENYLVDADYIKLDYWVDTRIVYTTISKLFDTSSHTREEGITIYLKRIKDLYELHVEADDPDPTTLVHRFTQSELPLWKGYDGAGLPEGVIHNNAITMAAYTQPIIEGYTVEEAAWYRIHVVGKGGDGGNGGAGKRKDLNCGEGVGSGGSSGSTGAYAIHEVYLDVGTEIHVNYNTARTMVTVDGTTIIANAGVNGNHGLDMECRTSTDRFAEPVSANSVAVVTASGGNIANMRGVAGVGSQWSDGSERYDAYYKAGYGNYIKDALAVYTPKEITPRNQSASSGPRLLGGAGAGGDGAWSAATSWRFGNIGGTGGQGGVVIEKSTYTSLTQPVPNDTYQAIWNS